MAPINSRPIETYRPIAAALWMIGSILGFSLIAVAGRELGEALPTFEIMLWRSVIGLAVVVGVAIATGRADQFRPRHMRLHLFRNVFHFAGQNLWLSALLLIPLSQLFALEFSYPILVALIAPFALSERLTLRRILAALIGFCGILVVARPFGEAGLSIGILTALACAVGFAGAAIYTKKLTRLTSITAILFWLTLMQSVFGLVTSAWDGQIDVPPLAMLHWMLAMGLGGLGAHFCLTRALELAPAAIVTPIDFGRLPVIALVGGLFYNEPIDLVVLLGGAIIFAGNYLNLSSEKPI
ncbi:MAG: DMT family transporter [Paracoccaceae bacterium]